MKVIMQLERDSDNSEPGEAEIECFENGQGEFVSIKLDGPEREVWVDRSELLRAINL